MEAFIDWIVSTRLSWFVTEFRWVWPIAETLHFCGLTLLAGTVGLFDLRVLGFVKGIAPSTLHASLPWGLAGFFISVVTGVMFISGTPDQYFYNDAFKLKAVLLVLLGTNAAVYYWREHARGGVGRRREVEHHRLHRQNAVRVLGRRRRRRGRRDQ